ncbi:MAG: alkaline phosphatase [Caulobacteraceae bacterium]
METATAARKEAKPSSRARNLIIFVGEGMDTTTVTAARILQAQLAAGPASAQPVGESNLLPFELFPATALTKTYTVDLQTTETAGAMSALMTGVKTNGASVSVDPSLKKGDCKVAAPPAPGAVGNPFGRLPTLLEQAKDAGLSAGLVTTGRVTQSAPAAAYAHASDRDWESDAFEPQAALAAGCVDIARQLAEFDHHGGLDLVFGGGRLKFLPVSAMDPFGGGAGERKDSRNLVEAWLVRHPDGLYLQTLKQFETTDWSRRRPVLGLFAPDRMAFSQDPVALKQPGGEPSLTQMTRAAIMSLRSNKRGYVLVVDAAGIDAGHQAGNAFRALTETIEFANAVRAARSLVNPGDTLIVVTATGGSTLTIGGYSQRGNGILNEAVGLGGQPEQDWRGLTYPTLIYANGPGAWTASATQPWGPKHYPHRGFEVSRAETQGDAPELAGAPVAAASAVLTELSEGPAELNDSAPASTVDQLPLLSEIGPQDPRYLQPASIPLPAQTHGGDDVPVYARGPGAQWIHGVLEQNALYWIMRQAVPALAKTAKPQ